MANKRTYDGVYNALKKISDEEGVDFGLDGMSPLDFKNKYFTGPGNIENLYNKLTKISDEEGIDFGQGSRDEWLASFGYRRGNNGSQYQTLDGKRVGGKSQQQVMSDTQQTLAENQRVINRIGNRQQRVGLDTGPRVQIGSQGWKLGQNRKVTPGQQRYNPSAGQIEQTFVTPSGNEYGTRELADLEQNTRDIVERPQTVSSQLEAAYAERDRLTQLMQQRIEQLEEGEDNRPWYLRMAGSASAADKMADSASPVNRWENDEEYIQLMAAARKNDELITTLEDRQKGNTNSFWHSLATDIANGYNFSLGGKTQMEDMRAAVDAQKHIESINKKREKGEELTAEELTAEAFLKNAEWDQRVQAEYGDQYGAWARAGKMGAKSADFMLDFLMMGGAPISLARGVMNGLVRMGGEYAAKGFGKYMLKATGATLGSMVSGAMVTNTVQLGKTSSDVAQTMLGDIYTDPQGNYVFGHFDENGKFVNGGEEFLSSLAEVERAGISENGSEVLGSFLPGSDKILKGLGLSRIARGLTALKGKKWYTNYSKFLNTSGFNGVPGEGLEEYGGTFLDFLMGGDEYKNLADLQTHVDIWLGVTTMGALLNGPKMVGAGYSAIQHQRYKKATNAADIEADATIGTDKWSQLRETIDGTPNEGMSDVVVNILNNNDLNDDAKRAAMEYVYNLQKMRGYSLGSTAAAKNDDGSEEEDRTSAELNQSYTEGYDTQIPDEMKAIFDEADAAREELEKHGKEFAKMVEEGAPAETLDYLLNLRDDFYTDEQITAAADYYQKQYRKMGVMDASDDRVDLEVERANAVVRSHTHQGTGMVVMARYDDQDYYVIGGEIGIDGAGRPVLDGTGGAVIVEDAVTGEKSVKPANDLQIVNTQNAADLIQQNETTLRQQLEQQADDDITYGSPAQEVYQQEDAVTLNDGAGGTVDGVIGMVPNAVDGVYVVYTSDGRALQLTADDLNRRIVTHNGVQVKSAPAQNQPQNAQAPVENAQVQQQNTQGAEAAGKAGQEQTGGDEPAASALSRIPVRMDENGQPMKNKKGRPILDWHKVSVEDAADALTETTGGDKLMARDTASSLVKDAQEKLEKIRKQKPKGEDPIEMAESRVAIRRAEEEQQAIIKQWQNVTQEIKRRMDAEAAERQAEIEAAKSEEQRQREAEEARQRKEQQDEQDRQRLREQIEKDKKARSKEYEPLVKARKEMAGDADAMDVLNDTEPRSLEEWVSSLLSPHSFLWLDASESERGLQTELGLKRADMQRFMTLFGTKENDAKPFGKAVLDIYEALPESMKNMYTDEDVARVVRDMFQSMENSAQMMHLTELNRIEQARQVMQENERREEEAEMEAWAEAYHLTPEERETFEDFLQQQASEEEQEIINNIIADESYRTSTEMDQQPVSGTAAAGTEGSEGQVQQTAEATGTGTDEEAADQGAEAQTGQPPVADNNVPGRTQSVDREALRELFRQIGADEVLADRISDYDVEQLTAMVEDWEAHNDDYGYVMEQQKDALKSKDKKVRDAAQQKVDEAQQVANEAFVPIEEYIEGLNVKYGIESEEPFDGAIPTPKIDRPRFQTNRQALIDAYESGDKSAITKAAKDIQQYVDEGLDSDDETTDGVQVADWAEDYDGNDPEKLADQYICRVFWDRYLDDDSDQEYIKTGLKPSMRNDNKFVGKFEANEVGVCTNPNVITYKKNPKNINVGFEIRTAQTDKGWVGGCDAGGSTYGMGIPVTAGANDRYFETEQECQTYWAQRALDYLESHHDKEAKNDPMAVYKAELRKIIDKEEDTIAATVKAARNGDKDAQTKLDKFGIKWEKKPVVRFVAQGEVESILNGNRYEGRFGNGRVDVTNNTEVTTAATADYRITFKDELDWTLNDRLRMKNEELGDGYIMDGYSLDDVATIEKHNPDGTYTKVYDAANPVAPSEQLKPTEPPSGQRPIGKTSTAEEIAAQEAQVDTTPTEAQKEAGNYQKGHIMIDGYDVTIENPKGSIRRGTDASGKQWEQEMHNTYGYIKGTEGVDGDHIDVFLSDNPVSGKVWVVDQVNKDGSFDEHKVMYGFANVADATKAYLSNYEEGWQGLGAISGISREEFKKWIESSHRKTKPFREYALAKSAEAKEKKNASKPAKEHKRIVSDEKMEELRKQLLAKFNNMNEGIDVERMLLGAMYAVGKIERGVTKFADYATQMVDEIGDAIRPYLKAFYEAVRNMPEAAPYRDQMTPADEVAAFDEYNFDKQRQPDVFAKAEQVVKKSKAKQQVKKIEKEVNQKLQQGELFAGDLFGEPEPAKEETKAQEPAKHKEPKLRPATEADLESEHPVVYLNGHPYNIIAVMRSGEQISATQFSKPKVDSVMLTNGKSVKLEDLMVEDENPGNEKPKPKTPWWNDSNRPQSIDPSDYRTYMTDEARKYFASHPAFGDWKRKDIAFVTAAVWDGVVVPYEALKDLPEIVAAEQVVKDATANGVLQISEEERDQHAQRLLDAEHGSAIFENGKIKKVNGVEDFSGSVRQERKALVIIGYPAAGKSSVFANRLSNELGARIIDSDTVKPWLKDFDGGNGAGYVQEASSEVAERALDIAVGRGDNIILPRIGGSSVIALSAALKLAGYDVQLYFNDVATVTSVDRATSRFAETGRYLSLQYLTSKDGVPSNNFINFAEKKIGDYINELSEGKVQELRGRLKRLLESETVDGTRLWQSLAADQGGYRTLDEYVSVLLEPRGTGVASGPSDLIFSYSEWKSNDVAFGEKPKEIWNSKSGKPMPTKEVKDNGVQSEQRLPGKPSSSGEGEGQEGRGTGRVREGLGSESNRDQYVGPEHSVTSQPAQPKQAPKHNNKHNNSGERGKDYAPTSPKARFNANVEAIKMMRELIDQDIEAPTKDQMEVLRQYSGWGGLGTYFNDESSAENKILRDLLDEEEYNDAVMSVNSAYYTPATVIDTLWDVAKAMGFKGGNIVEGSAGIGNIIGQMPKDISRQSDIEAVEIDKISGNILKLLYPDAKVHIQGFQDTVIRNGSVDLAITNVPFVTGLHVIDKVDKDLSRRFTNIHDFCIAKNIRKLREGGLGIFITSSGTLDKSTDLRAWITDEGQADVVGAFRLNNETFGGTKVTSDIIVVRKRVNGVKSPAAIDVSKASPLRVGTYEDKYGDEHQTTMVVNDYFKEHPEMMAGEMAFGYEKGDTFRPGSYGLYPVDGKNQDKMMAKFVKSMGDKADTAVPQQQPQQVAESNQLTAVKEGRMLIDDNGRICVSRYGEAVPLGLNDQKVKGQTKQQCFKDYQAVQAAVDDVLQQQLNDPNDEALKPKLAALNKAYDLFTKRYGMLHKNTAISFLRNDIDFPSFQALELYREEKDINGKVTVITSKPKLFSERVIGFKTEPQPKTVKDAVIASIFRTNGIDLDWIASKLNEVAAPPHGDKWTTEDVRKGILVSRLGFEDPSTGQLVIRYKYLSGNVREKLAIAEQYNAEGETAGRYAANIEELKKAVPMDIPAHLIDFSLGSSWIPVELYKDFVKETFDLDNVRIAHIEGSWAFDEGFSFRNEKNRSAGVYSEKFRETIYGHQLFASALNNRPYKVSKQVTEGWGSSKTTHTEVDQAATQACNVRIDEIKAEFREWTKKKMQDDPELARRIEKIYNDKFNALVPMEVGEEFLPERFEGANTGITLRPHQKLGAIKGLISPTMLAHEVGTGKSFTLITTAMEMRRLGTAKKPMIVVQNATVAQLTADAKLLYPNAKVLSLSEQDRDAEGRRAFYAKIKYNDWDIIIVPQSTFERIPDSPERELQFIQEKIDEKKHVIEAAQAAGVDSRDLEKLKRELEKIEQEYGDKSLDSDPANASNAPKRKKKDAKREAASLDKAETRAKEQLDRAVDDVQFFDDLGVDALLVDEAHEYKHLGFQTSMGRGIKGIDPSYSKKCAGLYNKTRSVYEKAGWKNVVFATGTPISNTAAEIWTFMKYLMPADVMRANDIYYFDDFVHNFGNVSQMLEFTTSGKFKENTRFAAYVNKPELIRIWSQVADTVRSADTEVKDKEPEEEGGKDQDVFLPQSPSLIRIMAAVRAELERFENMTGQQKKENSSIPLTMYGIAKRAAIDPRLVDAEAPDEPLSKTNAAVKEILKDLKATQSYKGTVAVFCDNQNRLGTNSTGKKVVDFNIYDDMKEKLIKAGVPEKQIAIVKSGMSITAKQKIFDAVNSGDIRVVLGSTQTLGTGVNMQERLHLLIHMDAPDRPMDYTQRNGRIKRQGNLHKEWGKTIRIVRFGVEDSLDVTAYQRLKTKSGFIDSIMNGKAALADNQTDRTVEEEEEGLFDNPVAVLSGSQYALKKNQAERELRKYQGKKAQWEADQIYVTNQLRHNANEIEAYKANIDKEQKTLDKIKGMFPDGTVKTITVEGVKIDMTKDDGAKKLGEAIKEKINDPVNAIVKRNRENAIYNDETLEYTIALDGHNIKFTVKVVRESVWENGKMKTIIHKYTSYSWPELNMDSMDSSRSVRDYLDEIIDQIVTGQDSQDRIDAMQQAISRINAETEQIQKRVGQPFQYGKELEEAEKNVEEYTALMKKEMEEKEAKYAEQQKEAEADGKGFNLNKAEEESEDEDLYRGMEEFADGQMFPINVTHAYSSFDVLGRTPTYSTDLMPDVYNSEVQMIDAIRRQYPTYYAHIEDGNVIMESWSHAMGAADGARQRKDQGSKSYVERKTRNAINAVNSLAKQMGLDVEVLTTIEGLEGKKARVKGWFNPKTGKITLVLPNHANRSDLINTLLHEGVAHFGLRKMFGQSFNTFLDNVYNNVSPEIKKRIEAAVKRNGWSRHEATEEYLARLAERTDFEHATNQGWWQKIKDFFLQMLTKAGVVMDELTDNELRYILWRSYDNLLHPDRRRNIFDKAREVSMQYQLRVGQYSDRERQRIQRTGKTDTNWMAAEEELLNSTDYASDEINAIVDKAKADGTYMLAPNGKPSNLNELQWAQVRTKAFKEWFGDWENDLENASKVVDENGEPKVMYHKTNLDVVNKGVPFYTFYEDSHFGTKGQANDRVRSNDTGVKMYEVFLNIRNPQRRPDADEDYLEDKDMTMAEYWQLMAERSKSQGHDGIVYLNEYEDKEHPADSWIAFSPNQIKSATENSGDFSTEDNDIRYSIRTKEPPKKTGVGYKVFVLKDGQLYPPMVANPNGEGTPVGVWLDADAAPVAGTSKTGRPQVKAGGKGTQGGSGQLAYRPGWHLGTIPYALQFGRKDANGERTLFPNNFVWAEVEYADDVDYQDEARKEGINANGKYQHSLAGLKHVPTDGSYMYRTNPDPRTDPWVITGAMRVKKILTRDEVDELVRKAGREPQQIQDGDIVTDEAVKELNDEIKATMEADEMGLLYRDDDDAWVDNVAKEFYEKAVAQDGVKFKEAWQDSMVSLKLIQNAIARETGRVATGAEDAYNFENRMHGRAKNMTEQYDYQYYRPLLKAFHEFCKSKGYTQEKGIEYLIAKSGLERNVYYAFRTAAKEKLLQDIVAEREKLDKEYAAGRITEEDYKNRKAALARQETEGIDDAMDEVRNTLAWQRANEDYEEGRIGYTVLIDRMEALIRSHFKNYDKFAHDYSGLTEAFAKDMYDAAQDIKKEAQAAIDPKAKANLWKEYDNAMKQAYITARQYADDAVFSAEQDNKDAIDNLWSSVKKATEETLKHSYESGMISRKTYNRVRDMFNYYIPLRGWDENKASDVYTYMGKDNVFSPAVKKTWGRTSKADNPLAYIGNIAVSTIIAGHRNMMKQHFLNYVMNNPTSLVSISQSWYENISSDEDNPTWILRTADTAGKSADEVAQIVNDFNEEMQQKQREGKAMPVTGHLRLDVHATKGQKAEHVVEVQRGGDTYQLYINGDPKAAQALNGTAEKAVSRISDTWLGRKITGVNRSMAAFFTSKNPAFVVSNLSRDLNMAGASVAINEGPEYNARFIANVAKVLRPRMGESSKWMPASKQPTGLMPSLIRKWQKGTLNPSNETERLFKEFMDEGGETGFVNMLSIDSFKEKMQEEIREMNGSSFTGSKGAKEIAAHKGLRMLGDIFEFYNRCAEDATRFIVYMTSRQMGKTLEESVADAKNVTLNFNRKGTGDMGNAETRDLFIFVNPAIQALANMYRMAKGHPLKFGAVTAAFVAGGALIPIINQWFLNMFGGDDDKDAYWNLPPWVRKNNLVFWVPGTKNFVTIPLSQEFRVFYGVGEMASSLAMDHPVDKWGLELFSSVADLVPINPTGNGGNLMVDFAPTMVQPLMQIGENVDFTGRPIWRENQGNKYAPMYTKAYISTPRWMTWSSELLNTATGGNEGKKGVVEKYMPFWGDYINNPAVWNHLMQGYFGGMYNTIAKTFDVAATAASGEVPKIYQTPVINRFLNRPVERDNAGALGEDYYNLKEDAEAIKYEMKVWRKKAADGDEDAQKHVEEIESSSDWKQAEVIAHYEKIMKDLRAGEKAATNKEEKDDIKRSISLYRQQLAEELAALSDGRETADIVMQQFNAAKSLEEKKKLKLRMERLERGDKKVSDSRKDIDKALAYSQDIDASSDSKGTDRYLELATAENIRDDARIKAAKAKIKDDERYAGIKKSIASHERAIAENRKLLGKGNDKIIMKIIDTHRNAMLKSIARIQEDDN